jgi:hypothetical protein
MTRNGYVLLSIAVILGAAYVYFFTDMFTKQAIQIIPQIRPGRPANASRSGNAPSVYPVSFLFDGKYKLTSLKVVAAEELKTNKYAHPSWHLISESNSLPTKNVIYGYAPKGMKAAIDRMRPEPLQPDVPYTLFVEAGKIKGQTNFFTKEMVSAP